MIIGSENMKNKDKKIKKEVSLIALSMKLSFSFLIFSLPAYAGVLPPYSWDFPCPWGEFFRKKECCKREERIVINNK